MKPIIIKPENREAIQAAIQAAEGRATARTITYEDIIDDIKRVEKHLCISKKAMLNIRADIDHNAQQFPNAYRYTPESTHYTMTRAASGWRLDSISRDTCRAPSRAVALTLTEEARAAIIAARECFGI